MESASWRRGRGWLAKCKTFETGHGPVFFPPGGRRYLRVLSNTAILRMTTGVATDAVQVNLKAEAVTGVNRSIRLCPIV